MKLDVHMVDNKIDGITIQPEIEKDDETRLHELSKVLLVRNPAVDFSNAVKRGEYNDVCDDDYHAILRHYRALNLLFVTDDTTNKTELYINIFELIENMFEMFLLVFEDYERIIEQNKKEVP